MATRWDNAIIARLAAGDRCTDDFCGAVLVCSWPMPPEVALAYAKLSASLRAALPPEAYIYPASTLHCTVATLRAFTGGPLDADARRRLVAAWTPVLEAARRAPEWPKGEFQLRMGPPTLEGAAGIFRYEDSDGAVWAMRRCLEAAIVAAGGVPAIGGGDRSSAKPLPSFAVAPPPHLPDIVHSTAVRWSAEPPDREAAHAAFGRVAASWAPLDITVQGARAVFESTPYMHMPYGDEDGAGAHVFWEEDAPRREHG
mmetsp:Transcript_17524/g.56506  ORF Transcript_17524/g.56506 Transcript_17524/m.56506 type:complete len:256 (+) Transcript_17524:97-864(+)